MCLSSSPSLSFSRRDLTEGKSQKSILYYQNKTSASLSLFCLVVCYLIDRVSIAAVQWHQPVEHQFLSSRQTSAYTESEREGGDAQGGQLGLCTVSFSSNI